MVTFASMDKTLHFFSSFFFFFPQVLQTLPSFLSSSHQVCKEEQEAAAITCEHKNKFCK